MKALYAVAVAVLTVQCAHVLAMPANDAYVPFEGSAWSFGPGGMIPDAEITCLENNATAKTDSKGRFSFPNTFRAGDKATLVMQKKHGWHTPFQGPTVTVPAAGLTGRNAEYTLQVPKPAMYVLLEAAVGLVHKGKCQFVVTVCAKNKTLHDDPQGIQNVTLTVDPPIKQKPIYFGMFKSGPLANETDPFQHEASTSLDGGVLWLNVEPSDTPHVITAHRDGYTFSTSTLWYRNRK